MSIHHLVRRFVEFARLNRKDEERAPKATRLQLGEFLDTKVLEARQRREEAARLAYADALAVGVAEIEQAVDRYRESQRARIRQARLDMKQAVAALDDLDRLVAYAAENPLPLIKCVVGSYAVTGGMDSCGPLSAEDLALRSIPDGWQPPAPPAVEVPESSAPADDQGR